MPRLALVPRPSSAPRSATARLSQIRGFLSSSIKMDAVLQPSEDKIRVLSHRQYDASDTLTPSAVLPSPLDQFRRWFIETQSHVREPEIMSVSTATASGIPSSRFVLLKEVDSRGFVFYTNYNSRKSRELEENPHAALALYWPEMHRQVRAVGRVERLTQKESEDYYRTRPLGSRIGAWASPQSSVVEEGELSKRYNEVKNSFGVKEGQLEADIPLPDFWGGWRVIPFEVEFWAGKPSRLHDRVRYTRKLDSDVEWRIERIAP
ncbi:PDX3 [Sanghuangporus vaninii]